MARAAEEFGAYPPDEVTGLVRLMCSWDTTEADVDALLAALDAAHEPAAPTRSGTGGESGGESNGESNRESDGAGVAPPTPGTAPAWT
jgi:hypothetical protein